MPSNQSELKTVLTSTCYTQLESDTSRNIEYEIVNDQTNSPCEASHYHFKSSQHAKPTRPTSDNNSHISIIPLNNLNFSMQNFNHLMTYDEDNFESGSNMPSFFRN